MSAAIIRELVLETRARGYSFIPGTLSPGYWGIGVPLLQGPANPVAAIVLVSTPARLGDERRAALGERMKKLGEEVMSRARLQAEKSTLESLSYQEA